MADRRRLRALGDVAAIRAAERGVARHELLLAGERERAAQEAREGADARSAAAAEAWQLHLARGFEPELARAFAMDLIEREREGAAARAETEHMASERTARAAEWCASDARLRQVEELIGEGRRSLARDREEAALEALADRITFAWSSTS
jgi:hypothetical protein